MEILSVLIVLGFFGVPLFFLLLYGEQKQEPQAGVKGGEAGSIPPRAPGEPTNRKPAASFFLLGSVLLLGAGGAKAADPEWPRQIAAPQATIVMYQPQPESLRGNILAARIAVAVTLKGRRQPIYGTVWTSSRVETDRNQRTVRIADLSVTQVTLPDGAEDRQTVARLLETEVPRWNLTLSLDRLEASLLDAQVEMASVEGLRTTPPRILFASVPTILVSIDGEPRLRPIENTPLQRVVNSPFPLIYDPASRSFYLNGGRLWYRAQHIHGPWTLIDNPPAAVAAVAPPDEETATPISLASGPAPHIVVATEPTELIVTDGAPHFASIPGTGLLYVANTESDVFLEVPSQQYYVLLSGRWFRAPSLDGPWSFVPPRELPADFQRISPQSVRGDVRAHVAGTDEARLALIDAMIPQTATIPRGEVRLNVTYDGPPQFEPIPGTDIEYAVNTSVPVLKIHGQYYACVEGVWYVAPNPTGPWSVATAVPPEVQAIPPSCPLYNTRFVYVYQYTPRVVYVGHTPGYLGCYPYDGTVVWGTGFPYMPWLRSHYYARPATWGFHARYHRWTGWTFGLSYNTGPFHLDFRWGGRQGETYRGGRWGPGGFRALPYVSVHNRWIRFPAPQMSPVDRGPDLYDRREMRPRDLQPGRAPRITPTPSVPGRSNDVFSNPDGGIFRRTDQGWEIRGRGGWPPSPPGAATRSPGVGTPSTPGGRPAPVPPAGAPIPRPGTPPPGGRPSPSPPSGGGDRRPGLFPSPGPRSGAAAGPSLNARPLQQDYRARELGRSLEGSFRIQGFGGRPGGFTISPRGGAGTGGGGSRGGRR